jgi:hypothetical protein
MSKYSVIGWIIGVLIGVALLQSSAPRWIAYLWLTGIACNTVYGVVQETKKQH